MFLYSKLLVLLGLIAIMVCKQVCLLINMRRNKILIIRSSDKQWRWRKKSRSSYTSPDGTHSSVTYGDRHSLHDVLKMVSSSLSSWTRYGGGYGNARHFFLNK